MSLDKIIDWENHNASLDLIDHIDKVSHLLRYPLPNEEADDIRREALQKIQRSLISQMADEIINKCL